MNIGWCLLWLVVSFFGQAVVPLGCAASTGGGTAKRLEAKYGIAESVYILGSYMDLLKINGTMQRLGDVQSETEASIELDRALAMVVDSRESERERYGAVISTQRSGGEEAQANASALAEMHRLYQSAMSSYLAFFDRYNASHLDAAATDVTAFLERMKEIGK